METLRKANELKEDVDRLTAFIEEFEEGYYLKKKPFIKTTVTKQLFFIRWKWKETKTDIDRDIVEDFVNALKVKRDAMQETLNCLIG